MSVPNFFFAEFIFCFAGSNEKALTGSNKTARLSGQSPESFGCPLNHSEQILGDSLGYEITRRD